MLASEFNPNYYQGYPKDPSRQFGLPNLNYLVTPLRFTVRRVRLVANNDKHANAFIAKKWSTQYIEGI